MTTLSEDLMESIEPDLMSEAIEVDESKPRRIWFYNVPYGSDINTELRGLGAKWDRSARAFYIGKSSKTSKKAIAIALHHATKQGNFKSSMDQRRNDGLILKGNTFRYKDKIKALGGVWDSVNKAWLMPNKESHAKAMGIMKGGHVSSTSVRSGVRVGSPKQVDYAMRLLRRLGRHGWHDSEFGSVARMPSRSDFEKMSSRDLSDMIDSLRGEF